MPNVLNEFKTPTDHCLLCDREMTKEAPLIQLFGEDPVCSSCRQKLTAVKKTIYLDNLAVFGLYRYNDAFARWIIQYKDCMDEVLADEFIRPYRTLLKRKAGRAILVPAPSFKSDIEERGFHHVEKLYQSLGCPIEHCFIKTKNFRQAKQSEDQRRQIKTAIQLIHTPKADRVILIDDVCTTGSTLRAMQEYLLKKGISSSAMVLALHPLLLQRSTVFDYPKRLYLKRSERRTHHER